MEPALNLLSVLIPKYRDGDERVLSVLKFLEEKHSSASFDSAQGKSLTASVSLKGLAGSSFSFILRAVSENRKGIHLAIVQDKEQAAYLLNDLETLGSNALFLPSSFKRPFSIDDKDTSSIQLRAEVLNAIRINESLVVVSYPEAIAEKVISKDQLEKNSLDIIKGEKLSLDFLSDLLHEYGFQRSDFVVEPGQFSIRGGIVDIFSFASDDPFRIELSGDEIESIRTFDVVNQLSLKNLERAVILPNVLEKLSEGKSRSFINYVLETSGGLHLWIDNISNMLNTVEEGLKNISEGKELFLSAEEMKKDLGKIPVLEFSGSSLSFAAATVSFSFSPQPDFNKNFDLLFENLRKQKAAGYSNLVLFDNPKQMDRLREIYESIFPPRLGETAELPFSEDLGAIHEGFIDHDKKISVYTDHQIFGRYHRYKIKSSGFKRSEAITLKMLKSLQPGDFVTHIDYGIGRFGGLEKILVNGKEQEAIRLVYKDNDTLYISIHSLHQISKYSGKESEVPKLDKLGSSAWTNLKKKTKKKIKELAFDLVKLYAERKSKKGFAFSPDNYLQNELEASFIYEDTPDQLKSTNEVKQDMEDESPMDRLVCGDVGFGKTEVAIRAAFKAACDSKQTAVLVPTTILALQHYKTFSERMKGLPVKVDYINRFKSSGEQKESLRRLEKGETDIIIGTHRLLGKDVKFKDLGLLVVDEEQKFGVGAKDKLKLMKANVDTLTLTATPIPRTLQFSMMGARDMSVINTPPPNRLPVHTEVHPFNEKIIRDAIEYEIQRGGQIFFVHNRVQTLGRFADLVQKLIPKARVLTAHGQLKGDALEKSMLRFIDGDYDVLVCTTIIESGLDIPNANTIIINDAHFYGLSDLYQLRGRVGRSNKKAFCYLLTPPFSTLTNEAKKRLRAIEEFSDLGSGFNVAMRDLDIRGAGNLLGAEQSGFITEIGYEMYQKILDEAMSELKEEMYDGRGLMNEGNIHQLSTINHQLYVKDCQIETDLSILIPDEYVENISERISLYQQLDNSRTENDLMNFERMLIDRFGKIPEQTRQLINVVRLRWLALELGFEKLVLKKGILIGYFIANPKSGFYESETFSKILNYVQGHPANCSVRQGEEKLSLVVEGIKSVAAAMEFMRKMRS